MLKTKNRMNNIGLRDNFFREQRIHIEQPLINNIENNKTPKHAVITGTNIINKRLLFNPINKYTINPVNKKKLTISKPVEAVYEDYKVPRQRTRQGPRTRSRRHNQKQRMRQHKVINPSFYNYSDYPNRYYYNDLIMPVYYPVPIPIQIEEKNEKKEEKKDKKELKEDFTINYNYNYLLIIILILYILVKWNQ
jgi:hypothetical protein